MNSDKEPLHKDGEIQTSIKVIKDSSENLSINNLSKKLIYYPLFHYQIQIFIKRFWFKSRSEPMIVTVDPIRKLPMLCDVIPEFNIINVGSDSIIPFYETSQVCDQIVIKFVRKYLFRKYPILFPPTVSIMNKILIYKIFFQFQSCNKENISILQDSITGEIFKIKG
ncbi:MAG: hypothetical protein A2161_04565 [Candidatus Schekmanbacteria bacterium RBG_13_48_7]|uniref:Uncharacterized protein n=1 Tax=Candidatus Schekmanbacteria bacterium RBG_13_48_7 TaxID=1817878 RepID=A0A1F7RSC7_9BACT|nr:MAG: hypothetical protein A2161_04565 [Candidatus Schekmanbacteria bacterium RBG_13_48_7]